ncbi:hypothetical protein MNBD_GAMMA12-1500 [hydrothermal vent metagenome]|uniref:Uncharacterized protein n=1 Tax=hydrothermal vent metagenome TaxID=652676 RepID=A0A3B0Z1G4_9ZZZZ
MKKIMLIVASLLLVGSVQAESKTEGMQQDNQHIKSWNLFAQRLYKMHLFYLTRYKTYQTEKIGGYARTPRFYRQVSYYDAASKRLLSRIQWVIKHPSRIHTVEIYVYDKSGRLQRDYLAAFLPRFRNAPIQTLVNLHAYSASLHAWRQFDASGNRIYEQCQGKFFGRQVNIVLTDDDMVALTGSRPEVMNSDSYIECFSGISSAATPYLNPLNEIKYRAGEVIKSGAQVNDRQVQQLSIKIERQPTNASLYIARGDVHFKLRHFDLAIIDFNKAIMLDPRLDKAWYGRGMARGRVGKVRAGIKDLSVYIQRNGKSSLAYTKRGVRYIWIREFKKAESDLRTAIKLNPNNAEAYDDLGVVVASKKQYQLAINYFKQSIRIDSSYLKAHHNIALVYHVTGQLQKALLAADSALRINHNAKNTLLLKAVVLDSMGKHKEASRIRDNAAFLTENNWSEVLKVQ